MRDNAGNPRLETLFTFLWFLALLWFSGLVEVASAADAKKPVLLLPLGHSQAVTSIALSGDGRLVLTGSLDSTAILWDVESTRPIRTFKGHTQSVHSVAMSGDGRKVFTGSLDNTAILWDVETTRPLRAFKGHASTVLSVALSSDEKRILTGSADHTAILWDVESARPIRTFKGHADGVTSVAFSGDGKRIFTGSSDHTAILWDVDRARPIRTFKGHTDAVSSVALSIDGKRAFTGSRDKTAILWDVDTARTLWTFKGHTASVYSVAMSVDGKRLVTGSPDRSAILWNAETFRPIRTFLHKDDVVSVALSGDGKQVVTGAWWGSDAILWDTDTGKPLRTFKSHLTCVNAMAVDNGGKWVFVGSPDGTVVLWDTETARPICTFKGHTSGVSSVALSADGRRLLTGSFDRTAILWDAATARPIRNFKGHTEPVYSVALSGDGKRVLTGSGHATAILWDAETARPLRTFKGNIWPVDFVALSVDGKRALIDSGGDAAILWDAETGRQLRTFKPKDSGCDLKTICLSSDGKRMLSGTTANTAILWDFETSAELLVFKGHTYWVDALALSGDGKRVLTGSWDNTAILWDAETAKPLQIFDGHTGRVESVGLADGGSLVFTASWDGTVRVWVPGRQESLCVFLRSGDEWLTWTPEGYYSCSPNGESLIAWRVDSGSPGSYRIVGPDQFRKTFYRPDLFPHLFRERDLTRALALADKERNRPAELPTTIARALPPNVAVLRPERDGDIEEETVNVEALAFNNGEHPVTRLRLLLDGRPYRGNASTFDVPDPRPGRVKRSWQVELEPGERTIQVIAESAVSEGRSDIVKIRRKTVTETLPRLFVLAIGVSDYENEALRKDVYYAAADARRFSDTVERSSKPLYHEVTVVRLIDLDASRRKVLRALTQLRKQATQRDTVIIYFAGHGELDDRGMFYFLPADVDREDLVGTGLSQAEFKATVQALAGRVILMLDACHSGKLIESGVHGRSGPGDGPMDVLYRDMRSNEVGLVVMCASKGQEKAMERSGGGLFTTALVEGLQGKAPRSNEGVVYLKALDGYVTERVKELSEGNQHPLTSVAATITNIPLAKP